MFNANNFRIIETKEEFLKDYNPENKVYDRIGVMMPQSFNVDEVNFPIAMKYVDSWDAHFRGYWYVTPMEEALENIKKEYQKQINYYTNKMIEINKIGG